jgi:hypothetical protein
VWNTSTAFAQEIPCAAQGDLAGHFGAWRVNGLPSGFRQRLAEVA